MTTTDAAIETTAESPAESPKSESPKSKLERQRAVDRNVQRVRKIEALAKACGDESTEAFVSFGLMGVVYTLTPGHSRSIAAAMLADALKEHDGDPDAGELPKDLQWVREIADAATSKSPSMKPENSKSAVAQNKTDGV